MASLDLFDDRLDLARLSLKDLVFVVDSLDRLVGRNLDDIQPIDLLKLFCLGEGSAGHTGQLVVEAEIILEGNGRQCLRFLPDRNVLLSLNRLVQAFAIATPFHQAPGELVDDDHLTVLSDDIVFVSLK